MPEPMPEPLELERDNGLMDDYEDTFGGVFSGFEAESDGYGDDRDSRSDHMIRGADNGLNDFTVPDFLKKD
jgi:hypothetical protein